MSIKHLNEVLSSPEMRESLVRRFNSKVKAGDPDECWPWIAKALAKYGYGRMTAGRGRYLRSHQVAWGLSNGMIPDGVVVRHSCDNPACCNPRHLEIGTQAQNIADTIARNRSSKPPYIAGEAHPRSKLNDEKVAAIRSSKKTLEALAAEYGVSTKSIWRVRKHHQWKVP